MPFSLEYFSPFQPRSPFLLHPSSSSSSSQKEEQQLSPPTAQDLIGTWHMISSSSNMWQDRKNSITITYSTSANGGDSHKLNDKTTWYTDGSDEKTSTRGISIAPESGYVWDWRGAGWLRWLTTQFEIVGMGEMSNLSHSDSAGTGERESEVNNTGVLVLVTFVQKTLFSPQALSVLVRQEHLHIAQEKDTLKYVIAALRSLGIESLCAEVDKLKVIDQKRND